MAFGSQKKCRAAISVRAWLAAIDDLVLSEEVREALAKDTGERVELTEVAREAGFDPTEFGL